MKIDNNSVTYAKICGFNPDDLDPSTKSLWDQLGDRIDAHNQYKKDHPILFKLSCMPIINIFLAESKVNHNG